MSLHRLNTMTDIGDTEEVVSNLYVGTRTNLLYIGTGRQYAVSFRTGAHTAGYKLDRIYTRTVDGLVQPRLSLYSNFSSAPNTKLCDFRNPQQIQHHTPYTGTKVLPTPFLAPNCASQTLAAASTYWIVFEGTNYRPLQTDSDDEYADGSGWSIGNTGSIKTTGSWGAVSGGGTIPVEIWASKR